MILRIMFHLPLQFENDAVRRSLEDKWTGHIREDANLRASSSKVFAQLRFSYYFTAEMGTGPAINLLDCV